MKKTLTLAALLCLALQAGAQAWPSKPMSDALKQPVIVQNKPGANGSTGTDSVAKSAPDGHTLVLCNVGALAITASVYSKMPFDPAKDLRGLTMLAYSPHLRVVHPSVPATNLAELVALSHQQPLNFAVTVIGTTTKDEA